MSALRSCVLVKCSSDNDGHVCMSALRSCVLVKCSSDNDGRV